MVNHLFFGRNVKPALKAKDGNIFFEIFLLCFECTKGQVKMCNIIFSLSMLKLRKYCQFNKKLWKNNSASNGEQTFLEMIVVQYSQRIIKNVYN
jgi:hypothetical protein